MPKEPYRGANATLFSFLDLIRRNQRNARLPFLERLSQCRVVRSLKHFHGQGNTDAFVLIGHHLRLLGQELAKARYWESDKHHRLAQFTLHLSPCCLELVDKPAT